ncbi:polysaccharide deacetylase [Pseudopedobacter saltans DSM 12145]|uniref:Polysaccharide deacetylase n=1 Tax=Pseudopedobacter saltans (strain ATCC 51119 / DSM 12145 / JCM 21818 / CCUG 39354 / LMG 10337 / NBRC 100064 / NCIMB 13643) TaxID=762903 RepID=F0SA97_PSESL|nr:polysaccharide deacetylase family protein [Pseudopedobacter saltans]ADY51474.1 polysaccharide deacetylase [Pseudopedobacter saltans DSM 12145]
MKLYIAAVALTLCSTLNSCSSNTNANEGNRSESNEKNVVESKKTSDSHSEQAVQKNRTIADAKTILARKQVPVLCYHQIRDWRATDSKTAKDYIIPPAAFKAQIKMLADSGYTTILPEQYYNYLAYGDKLPAKPVLITFDDTDLDQLLVGDKTLKQYGFKGAYFMMTVVIGKHGKVNYMNKDEIKQIANRGNTVGLHTYDHPNVKKIVGEDEWNKQITKPKTLLEEISGQKVEDFAYPFGLWNKEAIKALKARGLRSAYILATSRDDEDPLYTIRRIIASGYWSPKALHNAMISSFK